VPIVAPAPADEEIASATFWWHLNQLWEGGRPTRLGWGRIDLDSLHVVVSIPAQRSTGEIDDYFIRLGAEYYDAAPPTVAIVQPSGWTIASAPSRWFPVIKGPPSWFGLHSAFPSWPDKSNRQLVCFSFAAEYYMTDHSPKDSERWQQGRHTVAATLFRIAEILFPPYYQKPSK